MGQQICAGGLFHVFYIIAPLQSILLAAPKNLAASPGASSGIVARLYLRSIAPPLCTYLSLIASPPLELDPAQPVAAPEVPQGAE